MADVLPILMYHGVHEDASSDGRFDPVYSVRPADFAAQLAWLAARGYRSVLLRDLAHVEPGERVVAITFDDGDASNLSVAAPMLEAHGYTAEIFVTSDFVDQPGMLSSADLRELARRGFSIQSHGRTHRYLAALTPDELHEELVSSLSALSHRAGTVVDAIAFPGGRGGERELATARALGYRHVLGSVPGPNAQRTGILERIAITRDLSLERFAALVEWRGFAARKLRMRHDVLAFAKRALGNGRYEALRGRLVGGP